MNFDCYNSRCLTYKKPFGAICEDNSVEFRIRISRDKPFQNIKLVIGIEDCEKFYVSMDWIDTEYNTDTYSCEFVPNEPGLYFYYFELENNREINYIFNLADSKGFITDKQSIPFQLTVYDKNYITPDWFKGGVLYQIFPDRFFREGSMLKDDTKGRNFINEWGKYSFQSNHSVYPSHDYFGGNLDGIIKKLDYLKSLGVTAIYLNPIFYAHSYHRYNTADYMRIDPLLGNKDDLKNLCRKAGEKGIGIILDGVFSHTGTDSVYFNKDNTYKNDGAYNSKESIFYNWYRFEDYPEKYRCWWGIKDLPQINTDNPEFLEFITGENGVLKHWLDCGIKGLRLDVADELSPILIEKIRERLKKENKENILIGEVWEDASNKISYSERRQYLEGKQLDSVMNYPWRSSIINYVKTGDSTILSNCVNSILENYPKQTIDCLFNLLSTHDTARTITSLVGESSENKNTEWKQKTRIPECDKNRGINLLKIATIINYTLPGVPSIYYGDEIGMEGYEDPFNRRCFEWDGGNGEILDWYKTLGKLRNEQQVLIEGNYSEIKSEDGVFAFKRFSQNDELILFVNMGHEKFKTDISGNILLKNGKTEVSFKEAILKPQSFVLMKKSSESAI